MLSAWVSNRLEELFEILFEQLNDHRSLQPAVVIVSSPLIGAWLEQMLAQRSPSGTIGITIVSAHTGLPRILKELDLNVGLNPLETLLLLSERSLSDKEFCRRLYPTLTYAKYGIGKIADMEALFGTDQKRLFAQKLQFADLRRKTIAQTIFFFGWSSICPVYIAFLKSLGDITECFLLLFSPCMLFWSDVLSSSEESYLFRRLDRLQISLPVRKRLEELLADKHPFLANTGVLSRTLLDSLEEQGIVCAERYVLHEPFTQIAPYADVVRDEALIHTLVSQKNISLLERLQADMLLLISDRIEGEGVVADGSVQIIEAATPYQEVEAVKAALEQQLAGRKVEAGQVLIVAPRIQEYRAAIGRLFGTNSPSIPYQIIDPVEALADPIVKQFFRLLELAFKRMDLPELEELLECGAVAATLKMKREEKSRLFSLLRTSPFRFGIHVQHKNGVLAREGFTLNTADVCDTTLQSILDHHWNEGSLLPECDLLARVTCFLTAIWESVIETPESQSVANWMALARKIFQFAFVDDGSKSFEELWKVLLLQEIEPELQATSLSFDRFRIILKKILQLHFGAIESVHIWAPIVCTSLKAAIPPAEIVCILGQELGAFPDEGIESVWSYLDQFAKEELYDSALLGRKAFLEALFSARKSVIITHRTYSFERRADIPPSILIEELKEALQRRYGPDLVRGITRTHPFSVPLKQKYSSSYAGFSLAAQDPIVEDCGKIVDISIQDLLKIGRNPIHEFMKRRFGISSEWADPEDNLVPKQDVIKEVRSRIDGQLSFRQKSVSGYLGSVFEAEAAHLEKQFRKFFTSQESPISLTLAASCSEPLFTSESLRLPAYIIQSKTHRLSGSGLSLFPSAHLFFTTQFEAELVRRWPEVVLRALAKNQVPSSFSMNLLSLHDGREVIVENIDPEKNIEIWIQFLQYSEKNFLPLIHKVLKEINRKTLTLDSLMTIVTNEVENSRTRYSLATKASILDLTAAVSIEDLQEWAHLLYAGFPHE